MGLFNQNLYDFNLECSIPLLRQHSPIDDVDLFVRLREFSRKYVANQFPPATNASKILDHFLFGPTAPNIVADSQGPCPNVSRILWPIPMPF